MIPPVAEKISNIVKVNPDFPQRVHLQRAATLLRYPQVRAAIERLGGRISADDMQAMNDAADARHEDVKDIARRFLDTRIR